VADREATGRVRPGGDGSRLRAAQSGAAVGYRTAETLADVVLDRQSNPVTAYHVLNYIAVWGVFVESQGREPRSIREMSEIVGQSRATIDRWASKFRKTFPEYETPAVIWAQVRSKVLDPVDDADRLTLKLGAIPL
jgi:hypothetical protein